MDPGLEKGRRQKQAVQKQAVRGPGHPRSQGMGRRERFLCVARPG